MAVLRCYGIGPTVLCCLGAGLAAGLCPGNTRAGDGPIELRESSQRGSTTRVLIEMKGEGVAQPEQPAGLRPDKEAKPLALRVETRLAFDERVMTTNVLGSAQRVARHVVQAAAAINGEVRPTASAIRPEVALIVTELRDGVVFAYSPGGPLTRPELELVEGPGDPLALPALLPRKAVSVGDRWVVGNAAARSLSSYDALAVNRLEATLESADESTARIKLSGEVRGAALGGEGVIEFTGDFSFDRKLARVDQLTVSRTEKRKPGPVEAGLQIKSTLRVDRRSVRVPPELGDASVAALPSTRGEGGELLLFRSADGKYMLLHDRDWHMFADSVRQTVLKRLDHGELIAQCNLGVGPSAGKGRHQDPGQFRDDIRRALGPRFVRFLDAGEVQGPPDGVYRYRVAVEGKEGDVGVLWYYYLIASPEGEQLLATFTLGQAQAKQFAEQDLQLIGTLAWIEPEEGRPNRPK
jgi:hypothetical protein